LKKSDIDKIGLLLITSQDVVIITHTNPDGDAIGSSLAMYHYLKLKGHNVKLVVPSKYPDFLAWMPGVKEIKVFSDDREEISDDIERADIIFCLDFNSSDRMEEIQHVFENSSASKVLIDHHIDRESFCDFDYARTTTSSTSELVYDLIEKFGDAPLINREIAECLYVGIITDTGSFSYACEHERTFLVTAALVKTGIDTEHIHRLVYDTYSE
jgi:bifunctional oligoribonuclease and PAP phosphatase NrnA